MKPHNISTKDYLIKKIAEDINEERIIYQVISHQFDSANKATVSHNSVEISGFGKFVFNINKAKKQMLKYLSQEEMYAQQLEEATDDASRRNLEMRLQTIKHNIKILKPKLHNENED